MFNPPALSSALGWLRRDHRKLIVIDGVDGAGRGVAFVSGLCVGQMWEGRPEKKLHRGATPASRSSARPWRTRRNRSERAGGSPAAVADDVEIPQDAVPRGEVNLRLIPTEPFTGNLLRLDMLVTALARRSLWLTDAYFIGTGAYIEALRRAAHDGVDVRLLVPQCSDVGWTVPVARSLYRPLLEAGVRIFEWNGTMVHAKTAIADSRWARIGSTNLNINSWFGNWELDVALEDEGVAKELESHYLEDLERSTEIVLETYRLTTRRPRGSDAPRRASRRYRSSRRVVRAVTDVGRSIGAAVIGESSVWRTSKRGRSSARPCCSVRRSPWLLRPEGARMASSCRRVVDGDHVLRRGVDTEEKKTLAGSRVPEFQGSGSSVRARTLEPSNPGTSYDFLPCLSS